MIGVDCGRGLGINNIKFLNSSGADNKRTHQAQEEEEEEEEEEERLWIPQSELAPAGVLAD